MIGRRAASEPGTGTGRRPRPEAAAELLEAHARRGLLIGKGGLYGNVLRIAPPLSITEDEAAEGLDHPGSSHRTSSRRRGPWRS